MTFDFFSALFSFLFGLALGSFLNVCIYRIPAKISIIRPPSNCPRCGEKIRFYDNIPLLSFILLYGKCRYCHDKISWRYPAVEITAGLLSIALFTRYGFSYQYIILLFFTLALVTVSFIDLDHQIIPDIISLPGILAGLIVSLFSEHLLWHDSLIGIIAGGGSLFLIGKLYELITGKEGIGGGDVKLLAMIGAWMGWKALPLIVLMSSLIGAIIGSVFLLLSGKGLRARIPFGPFLSIGSLLYVFFGRELTNWYLCLFL
ncbi:MAG: prepilin peptidase [Deltaproteobacteria bacterium]|nr:prepilin peptidase [Deltaproteobacteria bacterium]HEN20998.1 prepilin peptidase [Desulfobacteraceae bacterium]